MGTIAPIRPWKELRENDEAFWKVSLPENKVKGSPHVSLQHNKLFITPLFFNAFSKAMHHFLAAIRTRYAKLKRLKKELEALSLPKNTNTSQ